MFSDDFSEYATGECLGEGQVFGNWTNAYSGYGCTSIVEVDGIRYLSLQPKASAAVSETHSSLVTGPSYDGGVQISCGVMATAQLRTGSPERPLGHCPRPLRGQIRCLEDLDIGSSRSSGSEPRSQ